MQPVKASDIAPLADSVDSHQESMLSAFTTLKGLCRKDPFPSIGTRKQRLKQLQHSLLKHEEALLYALKQDYGHRAPEESRLIELFPTLGEIKHAQRHLAKWMCPEKRHTHISIAPSKAKVMYQPKGVVGIISPWNYPVLLALGPLVGAIAAGNRAMLKVSEFCPHTNAVLRQLLNEALGEEWVIMIEGEADIANAFTQLPFDHLLFTGSTPVGRRVMANAAPNLTPVTLELGGKSPLIITPSADIKQVANCLIFGKLLNAGQTCVAPDYVLCHRRQKVALIHHMKQILAHAYPQGTQSADYTSLINERQFARLTSYLAEAKQAHVECENLMPQGPDMLGNKLAFHILNEPNDELAVMQDEIFGPLLPILQYTELDEALDQVRSRPRPLALYLFSQDEKEQRYVEENIVCGGMVINHTILHVAQADLPFGGVGASGMGMYHAIEGFRTFSHSKAVLHKQGPNLLNLLMPPYRSTAHRLLKRFWRFF